MEYSKGEIKMEIQKNEKKSILETANNIINGERQDQYGAPEDSFRIIANYWKTFLNERFSSQISLDISLTPIDVANMMILFKQARKLGQKPAIDNYIDSVGYEAIAADRLVDWGE